VAARARGAFGQRLGELGAASQPHAARQARDAPVFQTPNRVRPFARRARTTARPPRVRMRTRNPCVRLRRCFDG
jgi:hypothetical protein